MCRLINTAATILVLATLLACSQAPPPAQLAGEKQEATARATVIGSTAPSQHQALPIVEHSEHFRASLDASRAGFHGVGEPASAEQIAGWDIDVRPDGKGLPPGAGTAEAGEPLYEEKCAVCHGVFGEGQDRWPKLASDEALTGARPEKTVGNYWPYASTLWDYIHRAMPFFEPQSLSDNEVYAIVAYVLYLNDLLEYDAEINQHNLAALQMPNAGGFYPDPRPDTSNTPCMQDCKTPAATRVTRDATDIGVTPVDHLSAPAGDDAETIAAGKALAFDRDKGNCLACHAIEDGELPGNVAPPLLNMKARFPERAELTAQVWDASRRNPRTTMPPFGRHRMLSDGEIELIVSYLYSL
jgi:sulfur oxidation c-type cytochrome SoxX